MAIYIYDVDNSTLITPGYTNIGGAKYEFVTTFSTTDASNYRLIFHIATNKTTAYDVYFDDISVGPEELIQATPITEWTAFTPTFTVLTMSDSWSYYRRVGDTMEIISKNIVGSNTSAATDVMLTLPEGLHIDSLKVGGTNPNLGNIAYYDRNNSSNRETGTIGPSNNDSDKIKFYDNTYESFQGGLPFTWDIDDILSFNAKIPIAEWAGSSVGLANNRVEYASNSGNTNSTDDISFAYGPEGSLVPPASHSGTSGLRRKIKFLTPIQSTDTFSLQFKSGTITDNHWIDAETKGWQQQEADNGDMYGVRIDPSGPDTYIYFFGPGTYIGGPLWTSLNSSGYRWRVVKSSNPLSIRSGIVMPTEMTKEEATKLGKYTYLGDGTTYKDGIAATITGGTLIASQLIPYQMQNGSWRLKFNISTSTISANWNTTSDGYYINIYINGILFKNISTFYQAFTVNQHHLASGETHGYVNPNDNKLNIVGTINTEIIDLSGDVTLESKPDWAY